ncbi:TonB-dependent receptor [Hyphococcus sp.]|uniref:TonB-dependent receptor n=1 Tax=Hyphococcus sp. TaxID=2038636 RepID=UPI0035C75E29
MRSRLKSALLKTAGSAGLAAFCASAAVVAGAGVANAQDAASEASGDVIVVSARRRDESLLDVPIAVTAISGEQLELQGAQDITYLTQSVPNLTLKVSRGTNSTLTAFIRGVGQQDPVAGFESGVGVYVDDVYLNRPQAAVLDIYDVERIEVLRGPQGTLYGRNSVGGAVKYVTKRLGDEPTFKLRASGGTYGQFDVVGTAEMPLTDDFAVGGSVAYLSRNGFGENLTTGEENYDKDLLAFRASAEYDNDVLFVRLAGDYLKDKSSAKGGHRLLPSFFSAAPVLDDVYDSRGGITGENEAEAYGAALHVELSLNDNWTIKNIAAWRKDDNLQQIDFDALPAVDVDVPVIYDNEQFTEELQLLYESDAVAGVLGFYYIDANAFDTFDVVLDLTGSLTPAPFGPLPGLNANTTGEVDTKSWSVFGDLTFDLEELVGLSGVELAVGGRYTSDKRSSRVLRQTFIGGNTPALGGTSSVLIATTSDFEGEETFTDFSPRVSLSWSPNGDHNFYASYSQGFKGGSFDPRGQSSSVTVDFDGDGDVDADDVFEFFLFEPEEVDSYEIGWKARLADGRITSNLALFYADYTNVQIPGSQGGTDPVTMLPTFIGVTTNAGGAEFFGVEWEGTALLAEDMFGAGDAFSIGWGGGWIDADYTQFLVGTVDVSDQRVVQNTPEFSGALTTTYTHPANFFSRGGDVAFITQTSYKSRTNQFEVPNAYLDQGGYGLLDASLVWTSEDGKLQIGVHGKNLLDREYKVAGYNFVAQNADGSLATPLTPTLGLEGVLTAFYGAPRTITGTVQVQF